MDPFQVFVVIAAFNESSTIRAVVEKILSWYPHVVVVDDGSTDGTHLCVTDLRVHLLRHIINRGQGASLQTGIRFALDQGADVIVTFDADGQHDVEDIPSMVRPVLCGECDVCLGSRFMGTAHNIPLTRKLVLMGGVLFTRLVSGVRVTDIHNGLRAFSRQAARSINITMDRMAHASEILEEIQRKRLRFREVPVTIHYSTHSLHKGQSSWNALRIAAQVLLKKLEK